MYLSAAVSRQDRVPDDMKSSTPGAANEGEVQESLLALNHKDRQIRGFTRTSVRVDLPPIFRSGCFS